MKNIERGGIYFAAMNTPNGFASFFSEVFGSLDHLYIIKGGPGTGKSRMMREIAKKAKEAGYVTEEILCSSDPSSLDGVIIPKLSFGILDGTSPHIYEPKLPGAKDNIVDLGSFWNEAKLAERRAELEAISNAKARLFSAIYGYLDAVKQCDDTVISMTKKAIDYSKLEKAVEREVGKITEFNSFGKKANHTLRIRSAVSCDGMITLAAFAELSEKRYAILDIGKSADIFMRRLLEETDKRGCDVIVSYNPFSPDTPDALYYPQKDIAYYIGSEGDYEEKQINMRRFVENRALMPFKSNIRTIGRIRAALMTQLFADYRSVKRLHAEAEKIYSSAMDFSAKEEFTKEFIQKIGLNLADI